MSVLKKINRNISSKSKNALIFTILALISGSATAFASNEPKLHSIQEYKIEGMDLPRGYVAMLMDYDGIREKMKQDIESGHGQMWRAWMGEGLEDSESLYWWLLSDWLYINNREKDAYHAAFQALVFMRLDISTCPSNALREINDQFLYKYRHILELGVDAENIRYAILNSIRRAEERIEQEKSFQISCSIRVVKQAMERGNRSVNIFPRGNSDIRRKRIYSNQRNELERVRKEFSYDRAWRDADVNTIWSTLNQ